MKLSERRESILAATRNAAREYGESSFDSPYTHIDLNVSRGADSEYIGTANYMFGASVVGSRSWRYNNDAQPITAAEDDEIDDDLPAEDDVNLSDAQFDDARVDIDVHDDAEDAESEESEPEVEELEEDLQGNIEIDNNINNHYIAECDRCHGIFISSIEVSDQDIESIEGICPLCNRDSTQQLKWKIDEVER